MCSSTIDEYGDFYTLVEPLISLSLPGRLLKAIKEFSKFASPIFFPSNLKSIWLNHIYPLVQVSVQENRLNIKLVNSQLNKGL